MACQNSENDQKKLKETFIENAGEFLVIDRIDSSLLSQLEYDSLLNTEVSVDEVKRLSQHYTAFPGNDYLIFDYLDEYLKIDSMKKAGAYQQYLENLDIGMLRDAEAFILGRVKLASSLTGTLWGIRYTSYEACPYYHGVDLYLSLPNPKDQFFAIKVGAIATAVDPPMAVKSVLSADIRSDSLVLRYVNKEFDLGISEEKPSNQETQNWVYNYREGVFL